MQIIKGTIQTEIHFEPVLSIFKKRNKIAL